MIKSSANILWPAVAGVLAALLVLDRWVPTSVVADPMPVPGPGSYAQAVRLATPSVVNIYTAKLVTPARNPLLDDYQYRRFAPRNTDMQRVERSLGSGVIMTAEGHILTNNHVIAEADAIQVMLHDGRSANAMVIATDPATDLAVLKIQMPNLQAINIANSSEARVGDVVLAIGNPLGFGHSVTQGIVSAVGRHGLSASPYEDYIQTDASIHLGNSGGALIDSTGRLLGINTLIYTASNRSRTSTTGIGISLAIPANLATFVMHDLIKYGQVIRGWLGVSVEPVNAQLPSGAPIESLVVSGIAPAGPAEKAGIRIGDIITHINGEPVIDGRITTREIAQLRPGESVDITVQRGEERLELYTVVGIRQTAQAPRS